MDVNLHDLIYEPVGRDIDIDYSFLALIKSLSGQDFINLRISTDSKFTHAAMDGEGNIYELFFSFEEAVTFSAADGFYPCLTH